MKGGKWEWKVARFFSSWLTGGEDHHLVRAQASGAWVTNRSRAGKKVGISQAGDIAPAGPEVHPMVLEFCERIYTECKFYKNHPNWWSVFQGGEPKFLEWWEEAFTNARRHGERLPILVLKHNNQPPVVGHLFGDAIPGPSLTVTHGEYSITFHALTSISQIAPNEFLQIVRLRLWEEKEDFPQNR